MYVTHPIGYIREVPHTVPPQLWPPFPRGLSIRDGWGSGIAKAIWAARIGGFKIMILTETNINKHSYFCNRMGYDVVFSQAIITVDGDAQGVLGMIVQYQHQGCNIESTCFHGPNVVRCKVVTGKHAPLIGSYPPPPSTLEHLTELVEALTHFWDQETIVLWDLNANIKSQNPASRRSLSC